MSLTSKELATKVKTKEHLYGILAQSFYLPKIDSKAVTKDYLSKHILKDLPIFTIKKVEAIHHYFRFRKYNSSDLFENFSVINPKEKAETTWHGGGQATRSRMVM